MRHTWANAFVLALAVGSLATGYFALVAAEPEQAWHVSAHRMAGFAVVAVLIWKLPNVLRPLRRRFGAWTAQDWLAIAALTLLLIDILLGVAWAHAGKFSYMGASGMTWHSVLALLIAPLVLLHVARYRRLLRPRYWAERRSALRLVGLALAGAFLWQAGVRLNRTTGLAQAKRFTGSYAAGDFTGNAFPTTSWLNDRPEVIDAAAWTLAVAGAVESPLTVGYTDLESGAFGPREEEVATLDCTGGWHSTQRWSGVRLGRLLDAAGVQPSAASVTVTSATGYYRRYGMEQARGLLLATRVGGERLSHGHGAPVRLVTPGKRGFEWVKWVTRVEVNRTGSWLQPPLPLQ